MNLTLDLFLLRAKLNGSFWRDPYTAGNDRKTSFKSFWAIYRGDWGLSKTMAGLESWGMSQENDLKYGWRGRQKRTIQKGKSISWKK